MAVKIIPKYRKIKSSSESAQMTMEFMIVLPVMLTIAIISQNIMFYLSECASFDRASKDIIRIHSSSPTYSEDTATITAKITDDLNRVINQDYLELEVREEAGLSFNKYTATLRYFPNIFGMGLKDSVLGVPMPTATHEVQFTIDQYKPGVLI